MCRDELEIRDLRNSMRSRDGISGKSRAHDDDDTSGQRQKTRTGTSTASASAVVGCEISFILPANDKHIGIPGITREGGD